MTSQPAKSVRPNLKRLLLLIVAVEGILLLVLAFWAGYLYLVLAKLTEPVLAWTIRLACVAGTVAAVWQFYKIARQRRFRFSLRTLLIATSVLGVLLALVGNKVAWFQKLQAARHAVSYVEARNGAITIGSPNDATNEERMDWTDLRNAISLSFSTTTLDESDFAQLAKIPNLTSITIKNTPIIEEGFELLQHSPQLQFLVLENTGSSDATLERIREINSAWHVFQSHEEMKKWSLEQVRKMQAKREL